MEIINKKKEGQKAKGMSLPSARFELSSTRRSRGEGFPSSKGKHVILPRSNCHSWLWSWNDQVDVGTRRDSRVGLRRKLNLRKLPPPGCRRKYESVRCMCVYVCVYEQSRQCSVDFHSLDELGKRQSRAGLLSRSQITGEDLESDERKRHRPSVRKTHNRREGWRSLLERERERERGGRNQNCWRDRSLFMKKTTTNVCSLSLPLSSSSPSYLSQVRENFRL